MVLLPVCNMQEAAARAKKEGKALPSREEMIAAGREAVLRRFAENGCAELEGMIEVRGRQRGVHRVGSVVWAMIRRIRSVA